MKRGIVLWGIAVLIALAVAYYQRRTGPTYPLSGSYSIGGSETAYKLPRSGLTTGAALVAIPSPGEGASGTLIFKRFGTKDEFTPVPMVANEGKLAGALPVQPAAGKLEYYVVLTHDGREHRLPADPEDNPILRYKGPVPGAALIPHIALMFLALILGLRTMLASLAKPAEAGRLAFMTLLCLTLGGMILGPVVQKHAFGAYWTGWPNGHDLTDNKTLLMWGAWFVACGCLLVWRSATHRLRRIVLVAATTVMLAVYLVPHSFRGSQLDYDKLDKGISAEDAIDTGR